MPVCIENGLIGGGVRMMVQDQIHIAMRRTDCELMRSVRHRHNASVHESPLGPRAASTRNATSDMR